MPEKPELAATHRLFTRAFGHGLCPVKVATRTTAPRKGLHVLIEADQVAVVTGAAQGLGRALAAGLIDCGVSVVLADTATERLQTTAEEFTARGGRVLSVITDVSDAAAVDALASRTLEHFGRVDIVVNNAGIATHGGRPLWQTDPQDWQRVLAVNVLGVVHGIQAFVPHLVTAGAGHVVNIASLAGLTATPFAGAYCASKHAVVAISETLRAELEAMGLPIGVTVACSPSGGQGRSRTADLPLFRSLDNCSPSNAHVRDLHRRIAWTPMNVDERRRMRPKMRPKMRPPGLDCSRIIFMGGGAPDSIRTCGRRVLGNRCSIP